MIKKKKRIEHNNLKTSQLWKHTRICNKMLDENIKASPASLHIKTNKGKLCSFLLKQHTRPKSKSQNQNLNLHCIEQEQEPFSNPSTSTHHNQNYKCIAKKKKIISTQQKLTYPP